MEPIKATRGRPVGSVTYLDVTLGDLVASLGTDKARVRVDKRWAEAIGLVTQPQLKEAEQVSEAKIQFNVD